MAKCSRSILRPARPAGLPRSPCARTARPPGRNESGRCSASGMRQVFRSPSARTAAPSFRHALRSGPHRGVGIRFPFLSFRRVWRNVVAPSCGLPAPQARLSGPCGIMPCPPGRNESGRCSASGMRQALRSPSARTAAPAFRHALRSGPHCCGAGIRFRFYGFALWAERRVYRLKFALES